MSALLKKVLQPLEPYLQAPDLIEICINKPGEVWLEKTTGWEKHEDAKLTKDCLMEFGQVVATHSGQSFSEKTPKLSTVVPQYNFRIEVLGHKIVDSGFALSIRVGAAQRFPLSDYFDTSDEILITNALKEGKTILVAGGTSSGKTTLLNSMIRYVPNDKRIVSIEDSKELVIDQENTVRLLKSKTGTDIAQVSYKDLINSCMRLRPDRLIMGELDIDNTMPFLRLINTGHAGCMATVHASSSEASIEAMIMNGQLSGAPNSEAVRRYIEQAMDIIVHIKRIDRSTYKASIQEF